MVGVKMYLECHNCGYRKLFHPLTIDGVMVSQEFQCLECLAPLAQVAEPEDCDEPPKPE